MSITEIEQMSVEERLQAMEQLWDALCREDQEIESPAWHEGILKDRKNRIDSGDAKFFTLDQLKERFRR